MSGTIREQRIMAVVVYADGVVESYLVPAWNDLWLQIAGRETYSIDAHRVAVEVKQDGEENGQAGKG